MAPLSGGPLGPLGRWPPEQGPCFYLKDKAVRSRISSCLPYLCYTFKQEGMKLNEIRKRSKVALPRRTRESIGIGTAWGPARHTGIDSGGAIPSPPCSGRFCKRNWDVNYSPPV